MGSLWREEGVVGISSVVCVGGVVGREGASYQVTMWSGGCLTMDKVCFCCNIDLRIQFLISVLALCRLAGLVCGGFYGPWFYLVLTLDILYLGADFLVIYSLFWKKDEGKPS